MSDAPLYLHRLIVQVQPRVARHLLFLYLLSPLTNMDQYGKWREHA